MAHAGKRSRSCGRISDAVELDDAELNKAKFEAGPIAQALNKSFTAISLAYMNTAPLINSYYANQLLIQALPPKSSPLLQLPYLTPAIAKSVEGDSRTHMSVQGFMDRPDSQRRSLAVGKGLLTEEQYKEAVNVAKQLPYLRVAKAFFKVTGERFIIPSSLVTLVVKGRFVPRQRECSRDQRAGPGGHRPGRGRPGCHSRSPDEEADWQGRERQAHPGGCPERASSPRRSSTHPTSRQDHSPRWHVFLTDSKQGRVAVPPFTFAQFDQPIFEADGKTPTFAMQTLKAQFAAPPQAGHYTFVMHVVCDSYAGFDTKMEVTLIVEEASKAAEMAAEDEISEPDEGKLSPAPPGDVSSYPSFSPFPCVPY